MNFELTLYPENAQTATERDTILMIRNAFDDRRLRDECRDARGWATRLRVRFGPNRKLTVVRRRVRGRADVVSIYFNRYDKAVILARIHPATERREGSAD